MSSMKSRVPFSAMTMDDLEDLNDEIREQTVRSRGVKSPKKEKFEDAKPKKFNQVKRGKDHNWD